VSDCSLTPSEQFLTYIMARTSYVSMKWWWWLWCLICTRKHA